MIAFPNAKINLGLNVLEKRKDGFHNIESCFFPIQLSDILEVIPAKEFSFRTTGLPIPGTQEGNLVLKAYNLLAQHQQLPNVAIHLHKVIPMGAGLGGGSSDGAFMLKMLNDLFALNLTSVQMNALASEMGSDCPFFLLNKPALATQKGTALEEIDLDLDDYNVEILHPEVHVSTAEAYSLIKPKKKRKSSIREIVNSPVKQWQGNLLNDFEAPILERHPSIAETKKHLLERGAVYASMTGSGSAVFGLFNK